ncbi:hypothetical protein D3C76_1350410 [compost metagenome]
MRSALGNLQALGQGLQRQAARLAGEAFEETEGAFDLATGHGKGPLWISADSRGHPMDAETGTPFQYRLPIKCSN